MKEQSKKYGLSNQGAARLYQRSQQLLKPGSGILLNTEAIIGQQIDYVSCIAVPFSVAQEHLKHSQIPLAVIISQKELSQDVKIRQILIYQAINGESLLKKIDLFIIQWTANIDQKLFLGLLKWLQANIKSIAIKINLTAQNCLDYQSFLADFSSKILQQPDLFLQAISLMLPLPQFMHFQQEKTVLNLLGIWRRALPSGFSNLIIQDWLDIFPQKPVLELHRFSNILCWQILFASSRIENFVRLSCECLGIQ